MSYILYYFVIYKCLNMDLLSKSNKYQQFLNRIQAYKEIVDKNKAFSTIQNRVDIVFTELKTKKDKSFYENIHLGLVICIVGVGLFCILKGHYFKGTINIFIALAIKYFYNYALSKQINESHEDQELLKTTAFDIQLLQKIRYLIGGIDVKITRISIVRNSFILAFPFIMFSLASSIQSLENLGWFVPCMIAFITGGLFWFYFFKDDIDELEFHQLELKEYLIDFESKSAKENQVNNASVYDLDEEDDSTEKQYIETEKEHESEINFHISNKNHEIKQMRLDI